MSGGGKGGSNTQATEIPDWLVEPSIRNIARAEDAQRIEYMPWRGPDVAAFNPTQKMGMQSNMDAASAFGLVPQGSQALQGMPQATTYADGTQGYSSMPLYEQALAETRLKQPTAMGQYDALFSPRVDETGNVLPSQTMKVAAGNNSDYANYGMNYSDGADLSQYTNRTTGAIDWNAANAANANQTVNYGMVDGIGVTNPNGSYGYGDSGGSDMGSPESYDGGGDMGGGYDVGDDSVGISSY